MSPCSPDIVTIMLGTNDANITTGREFNRVRDTTILDYVDKIRSLRWFQPIPKISIPVPPPLYDPYAFDMNRTIINTIVPTLIRDISGVMDTGLIDIYSAFNSSELSCDGSLPIGAERRHRQRNLSGHYIQLEANWHICWRSAFAGDANIDCCTVRDEDVSSGVSRVLSVPVYNIVSRWWCIIIMWQAHHPAGSARSHTPYTVVLMK